MKRLLTHAEAADYCGMSVPHFDNHIAVEPLAFGSKRLWDRMAIDHFLDIRSGLGNDARSVEEWLKLA